MSTELTIENRMTMGFDGEKMDITTLSEKLHSDHEFAQSLLLEWDAISQVVKQYKRELKATKDALRDKVKQENEVVERKHLEEVVSKLELVESSNVPDELISMNNKDIKKWIKDEKAKMATWKKEQKQKKDADTEQKKEKKKEKMRSDISKWNDTLSVVLACDDETDYETMQTMHTRGKFLSQLKKMSEKLVNIPNYDEEEVESGQLKEMHTRCKLLIKYHKGDDETVIDYTMKQTNDELKQSNAN